MNTVQFLGAVGVLLLIVAACVLSGRRVRNAADFESNSGNASATAVAGMIMGSVVGASSTIGTAQLAYRYGLSAWWVTLGSGLGCLAVALFYVRPFRRTKSPTLIGILGQEYGKTVGIVVSILSCAGMFLNIIAHLVAATAVLPAIFPQMSTALCLVLAASLMMVYVIFGGSVGAGQAGKIKVFLLYLTVIVGAYIVLTKTGLPDLGHTLDQATYFHPFARGGSIELSHATSMLLGIICTQTYMQAIVSGRSERVARRGALLSAALIPPIGLGSALIGMFMRVNHPDLENSKDVFAQFVLTYMPDLLGGIVMGTLLITLVAGGAGIALGISTVITNDVVRPMTHRFDHSTPALRFTRVCIFLLLAGATICSLGSLSEMILTFSFMSMGLRVAVIFVPFMCAILLPGKIAPVWILISAAAGPVLVLVFNLWQVFPIDALFIGLAGNLICCALGYFHTQYKAPRKL